MSSDSAPLVTAQITMRDLELANFCFYPTKDGLHLYGMGDHDDGESVYELKHPIYMCLIGGGANDDQSFVFADKQTQIILNLNTEFAMHSSEDDDDFAAGPKLFTQGHGFLDN